jgi:hypothetical protein
MAVIEKYVLQYILKYGGQFIMDLLAKYLRKKEQEKALDKLEKSEADPNSKVEERAKNYEDFINSGR